jgi:hypothetical protein
MAATTAAAVSIMTIEVLMLFALIVLLPMASWTYTGYLYRRIEMCIAESNASNFEKEFQNGQNRLQQWYWKQLTIRYLLLSVYSSVVGLLLWEHK